MPLWVSIITMHYEDGSSTTQEKHIKLNHLCGSGGHGHVIRSDSDVNTLFQLRTEVKRLGPLLTGFLSGAPGNKQTNGWVNRNIPAHTIACSLRRWLDKAFAESSGPSRSSFTEHDFLFPGPLKPMHVKYPPIPTVPIQMDQQYKTLLMLLIWSYTLGRMDSYTKEWQKCVDL